MEVNLIVRENLQEFNTVPSKVELFQPKKCPPETPSAGRKVNLLNFFGAILQTNE
jgi:hypothetical protein